MMRRHSRFKQIKPSATVVDGRFQRDLDERRTKEMAENFSIDLLGVPVVSQREDGAIMRIDGQHRLAAAILAGFGDVPVTMEVHFGLSPKQEADLFLRLNEKRKSVRAVDRFKARLVAEEPVALEIRSSLQKVKCKITKTPQRGGVMAIEAVERAFHQGTLDQTMRALYAWLDGSPDAFDGHLVRAVSAFFSAYPEASPLHLASRLETHAPSKVLARIKREHQSASPSRADAARVVLASVYNARTPRAKRVGVSAPAVAA